jgi:SpoVK/Ycf46/Vps4 family AAA+-type ATPase
MKHLQENKRLAFDVTNAVLCKIAEGAIGYTGADLKQLVQCASRLAMKRVIMVILKQKIII